MNSRGILLLTTTRARAKHRASLLLVLRFLVGAGNTIHADTTFTGNSNAGPGDGTCDATGCTLREAINAANSTPGADTILFDLGQSATITPDSELPFITDSAGLTIDGQSPSITI